MKGVEFKGLEYKVVDVDDKGIVSIYFNAYNIEDSDGDISAPGSFNKTVSENFNRIKHYANHDSRLLLGLPIEINANDPYGPLTRSKMNLNKELGRDYYEDYKLAAELGRTLEHSFGFNVVKRDTKDTRIILEYKLWEYSTLTSWGANEHTPLVDLKNLKSEDIIAQIKQLTEMYNRSYSDNRLLHIETALKSLTNEPGKDTTQTAEPTEAELIKEFTKKFTLN